MCESQSVSLFCHDLITQLKMNNLIMIGSSSCPQRGCYDCPTYAPGENPFFKERHKEAEHVRARDFIESGEADKWRKVVKL